MKLIYILIYILCIGKINGSSTGTRIKHLAFDLFPYTVDSITDLANIITYYQNKTASDICPKETCFSKSNDTELQTSNVTTTEPNFKRPFVAFIAVALPSWCIIVAFAVAASQGKATSIYFILIIFAFSMSFGFIIYPVLVFCGFMRLFINPNKEGPLARWETIGFGFNLLEGLTEAPLTIIIGLVFWIWDGISRAPFDLDIPILGCSVYCTDNITAGDIQVLGTLWSYLMYLKAVGTWHLYCRDKTRTPALFESLKASICFFPDVTFRILAFSLMASLSYWCAILVAVLLALFSSILALQTRQDGKTNYGDYFTVTAIISILCPSVCGELPNLLLKASETSPKEKENYKVLGIKQDYDIETEKVDNRKSKKKNSPSGKEELNENVANMLSGKAKQEMNDVKSQNENMDNSQSVKEGFMIIKSKNENVVNSQSEKEKFDKVKSENKNMTNILLGIEELDEVKSKTENVSNAQSGKEEIVNIVSEDENVSAIQLGIEELDETKSKKEHVADSQSGKELNNVISENLNEDDVKSGMKDIDEVKSKNKNIGDAHSRKEVLDNTKSENKNRTDVQSEIGELIQVKSKYEDVADTQSGKDEVVKVKSESKEVCHTKFGNGEMEVNDVKSKNERFHDTQSRKEGKADALSGGDEIINFNQEIEGVKGVQSQKKIMIDENLENENLQLEIDEEGHIQSENKKLYNVQLEEKVVELTIRAKSGNFVNSGSNKSDHKKSSDKSKDCVQATNEVVNEAKMLNENMNYIESVSNAINNGKSGKERSYKDECHVETVNKAVDTMNFVNEELKEIKLPNEEKDKVKTEILPNNATVSIESANESLSQNIPQIILYQSRYINHQRKICFMILTLGLIIAAISNLKMIYHEKVNYVLLFVASAIFGIITLIQSFLSYPACLQIEKKVKIEQNNILKKVDIHEQIMQIIREEKDRKNVEDLCDMSWLNIIFRMRMIWYFVFIGANLAGMVYRLWNPFNTSEMRFLQFNTIMDFFWEHYLPSFVITISLIVSVVIGQKYETKSVFYLMIFGLLLGPIIYPVAMLIGYWSLARFPSRRNNLKNLDKFSVFASNFKRLTMSYGSIAQSFFRLHSLLHLESAISRTSTPNFSWWGDSLTIILLTFTIFDSSVWIHLTQVDTKYPDLWSTTKTALWLTPHILFRTLSIILIITILRWYSIPLFALMILFNFIISIRASNHMSSSLGNSIATVIISTLAPVVYTEYDTTVERGNIVKYLKKYIQKQVVLTFFLLVGGLIASASVLYLNNNYIVTDKQNNPIKVPLFEHLGKEATFNNTYIENFTDEEVCCYYIQTFEDATPTLNILLALAILLGLISLLTLPKKCQDKLVFLAKDTKENRKEDADNGNNMEMDAT